MLIRLRCLQGRKEETEGGEIVVIERLWPGGKCLQELERNREEERRGEKRKRNRRGRKEGTAMVAVHGRQRKGEKGRGREKSPPRPGKNENRRWGI